MTDTDETTIRLPHSGMWVPDLSLSLTAYTEMQTTHGVAFKANLRVNKKAVGVVENTGRGGMTMFYASDPKTFGENHLRDYARRCGTAEGKTVDPEMLLDQLVEEHDWSRRVASAARRNRLVLRQMDHYYEDEAPFVTEIAQSMVPRHDKDWAQLSRQISEKVRPSSKSWWQAWTGTAWRDVTARPDGTNKDLYY